ncbi:cordon-bleu protein-like 1 isoform X6 [Diachasmimorpha longicaudata]|uniref:cordon-bleu protein-like 1 isoform X6 n=1 Tax=Diachasmimorpha longicaudata TaxID=58733 RepID=UPI0030B88913
MGFKLHTWFRRRRSKEEKSTTMVLTVTEDTPADMLTGSMELLVQLPRDHHVHSQRVTVERSTAMMDLLVQIATAHKLAASSYTLQAIGERGVVLPHQPNTPIGALDALQVKLLPKQGTFIPRKAKQPNQPFETTFRLQVHLPRNQLYVSRVSPKMNLGEIIDEVCREKNLDRNKYELRHPGNHQEVLDLSLSLQDYHLQEVTLYAKQGQSLGSALSSQDIMALQRQEERRRQQAKQSVFGFMFRKSKESSLSTDSLGGRSVSPAHSDETGRSVSPLAPPTRPQRKRRPAPNPPVNKTTNNNNDGTKDENKEKLVISHSRNSSDSSGYHEASVLSDNPDSAGRMPETLPRRSKPPGKFETRKLAHTSQTSKSLSNLAVTSASLSHATSNTSLSSTGIRKKRAAPPPPMSRPLSSAISTQALERIVDSEESLTSDMGISKPPSDIGSNSKANSDIAVGSETPEPISKDFYHKSDKENKKVGSEMTEKITDTSESRKSHISEQVDAPEHIVETARVAKRDKEDQPSDTDILLQRVSTTLATVLPSSPQDSPNLHNPLETPKSDPEPATSPNQTLNSQHDTSDYVSASGEDLSGTDWEYQLPDPPSAFRDSSSPDPSGYETITLGSVEAFKDPIAIIDPPVETPPSPIPSPQPLKSQKKPPPTLEKPRKTSLTSSRVPLVSQFSQESRHSDVAVDLKKDIISELETKIESGLMPLKIPEDSKKILNKSSPQLAPVDNTLSNFTITTYSNQKSPNIYESPEDSEKIFPESSDERTVKTFATLSRNRSLFTKESPASSKTDKNIEGRGMMRAQSVQDIDSEGTKLKLPSLKAVERPNVTLRPRDEKSSAVHRSKSYIVLSNNSKYREEKKSIDVVDKMFKSTSYTNLNQEDELQSVQVLKSILPHLNKTLPEEKIEKSSEKCDDSKRYKWPGPPAISLGSWSERPSVNVQIKHDTDYKFGVSNQSGGKTVVNLNPSTNGVEVNYERATKILPKKSFAHDKLNFTNNEVEIVEKNDKQEVKGHYNERTNVFQESLTKNLGKRGLLNGKIEENPGVKEPSKIIPNEDDVKIDTRPVNFKELTQAFGQVNLRSRSKYSQNSQNRHSDFFDSRQENDVKETVKISDWPKVKRYTSVVGINPQMNSNGFKNEIMKNVPSKGNGIMPVVKGFKVQDLQSELNSHNSMEKFTVPPPPNMPVITGVTLKSSKPRPKSMNVCQEPRDQLLESIRNFGREKLKSVSSVS